MWMRMQISSEINDDCLHKTRPPQLLGGGYFYKLFDGSYALLLYPNKVQQIFYFAYDIESVLK